MAARGSALVLGGGGVAGIAWEIGVITGLADQGVELRTADTIVGTSAGATVAAQVAGPGELEDQFARQLTPVEASAEMAVAYDPDATERLVREAVAAGCTPRELRQRVGRFALDATTPDGQVRRRVVASRLPVPEWPEARVLLTAVDTESGERTVFDGRRGVALVDAVAASSAVPGVWPPVPIGGRRYMDGGIYSMLHLDLVAESDRVLALAPMPDDIAKLQPDLGALEEHLQRTGRLATVRPDARSQEIFAGDVLDPAARRPAAEAGRAQGRAEAAAIGAFWAVGTR